MTDRITDEVFTDPEYEVELPTGETLRYKKFIGMKHENQALQLQPQLREICSEDVTSSSQIFELMSSSKGSKLLYKLTSLITGKDVKYCEDNLGAPEIFLVITLFFSNISQRMERLERIKDQALKASGSSISMQLPVENGDGASKEPTELPKKK